MRDIWLKQFTCCKGLYGDACPHGAPVRRANPRTSDMPEGTHGLLALALPTLDFDRRHLHDDLDHAAPLLGSRKPLWRGGPADGYTRPTANGLNSNTGEPEASSLKTQSQHLKLETGTARLFWTEIIGKSTK